MRKAINSNPVVQVGLLGALGILVAVVFLSRMGGSSPPPAETAETATQSSAATAPPATAATPTAPSTPAPEAVAPPASPAGSTPFEASKGLPADLVKAYESGDVVVLLVMQDKGIEDAPLRRNVESLEGRGDTSVFITDAKHATRYSRIAEGVNLDRVPAIIVLAPLEGKLSGDAIAPLPTATVTYGFRGKESVNQAVEDALYRGKQLSYDPG